MTSPKVLKPPNFYDLSHVIKVENEKSSLMLCLFLAYKKNPLVSFLHLDYVNLHLESARRICQSRDRHQ